MPDRHLKIASCLLLALLAAVPAQAQESSWGLRVFALGGGNFPTQNLGSNAVEIDQKGTLQVVAELETSPSLGGGLEFLLLDHNLRIRGQIMTTVGARSRGALGLCESGKLADPGQGLCDLDLETDAQILDGTAELVFLAGNPDRWVRPTFSLGVGVRSFNFESDSLDCDQIGSQSGDTYRICQRSKEVLQDPSVNPTLTFGFGLEAGGDPLSAFARLAAVTGSYSGGTGRADGSRQVDLGLTVGLAFRVR